MTNEHVEQLVKKYYGSLLPGVMPLLLELIVEAKAEAYSEAAKAACPYCREGNSVLPTSTGRWYHPHANPGHPVAIEMPCDAWAIRNLMAQLTSAIGDANESESVRH